MSAPLLEVRRLTKCYRLYHKESDRLKELLFKKKYHRDFCANKEITFTLHRGETLGIIGVNGAGKSTLLKQIAGVIEPTSGEILRHGRVTALLELGTGFNQELNGLQNIFFNGLLIGMSREEVERKLDDIIAFSELGEFIEEPVRTYSSGMLMRLAFSIAIHSDPQILIVDEALAVGDAHFSAKCTRALNAFKKREDMGIIYVSHDMNSLKLLCDRLLLLDGGRLVDEGNPEEVVNHYNYLIARLNTEMGGEKVKKLGKNLHGSGEVEIEQVSVTGARSGADILSAGERAEIVIDLVAREDLEDVSAGIMIRDRYGQDIFGTRSYDLGETITLAKGERYRFRYTLAMNLGPGAYSLAVAVHQDVEGKNRRLIWKDGAALFEIAGTLGPRFQGLCRLEPAFRVERAGAPRVLVTTSRSLLLVDLESGEIRPVHRGRGLYYGMSVHEGRLYVAARGRMVSSEIDPSQERGVILVFDRRLEEVGRLESPFPLRDLHQIRWIGDRLYATCSYDNMVAIYDGSQWHRWYPASVRGEDANHFNSIRRLAGGELALLAHNFGASEILLFDEAEGSCRRRLPLGRQAHNLGHNADTGYWTLSSEEGCMVTERAGRRFETGGFPRGIARAGQWVVVGVSQKAERSRRDFTDGRLILFDAGERKVGEILLPQEGMVLDIVPVATTPDPWSGEAFALDTGTEMSRTKDNG